MSPRFFGFGDPKPAAQHVATVDGFEPDDDDESDGGLLAEL